MINAVSIVAFIFVLKTGDLGSTGMVVLAQVRQVLVMVHVPVSIAMW